MPNQVGACFQRAWLKCAVSSRQHSRVFYSSAVVALPKAKKDARLGVLSCSRLASQLGGSRLVRYAASHSGGVAGNLTCAALNH